MDEARRVIERLARIEELKRGGAAPRELLAEIRSLLADGEAWLAAERAGGRGAEVERAGLVLERCRERLDEGTSAPGEVVFGIAV